MTNNAEILTSVAEMQVFRGKIARGFHIRKIPFSQTRAWSLVNGAIGHQSGGFFSVVGAACDRDETSRGVYLYQPQQALNGLLTTTIDGESYFLVHARIEPGNLGVVQFAPTIQSTPANYLRLHGGRGTPYISHFFSPQAGSVPYADINQPDLGERYFMKNKRLVYVEVETPLATEPNFAWVPASVMCLAARESALLNTDLRSMLALLPWRKILRQPAQSDVATALRASMDSDLRPEILGRVMTALGTQADLAPKLNTMLPLHELSNWELSEQGLRERHPSQGFDVEFFEITAPGREVEQWVQPLINSRTPGGLDLYLRLRDGRLEALVTVMAERGLACGAALFPTRMSYPGGTRLTGAAGMSPSVPDATVVMETTESDEGGRFFFDESQYRLVLVSDDLPEHDTQTWLNMNELQFVLQRSNTCSIQLRCVASLLFGII